MPPVTDEELRRKREEKLRQIREAEEEDLAQRKAQTLGLGYVNLSGKKISARALEMIPEARARRLRAIVFSRTKEEISLAAINPESDETSELIHELQKFGRVEVFVASPRTLEEALKQYQSLPKARPELIGILSVPQNFISAAAKGPNLLENFKNFFSSLPDISVSEILAMLFAYAVILEASDIHIEPLKEKTRLRVRLDGILFDVAMIEKALYESIRNRIKLTAGLKVNIQEEPQDGRFTLKLPEEEIEIRVSTIPGPYGENVVMRILNPKLIKIELEELGLRPDDLNILKEELKRPNGMIIVTGPTGSGKTTTLYASLRHISSPEIKIITLEDPIEYHLPGIEQTQVNPREGYDFENGLRAILRQDPDVILVGEIRDLKTAETAMHASLTGHLVFTTLHTNDAAGAVPRLIDLGVKPAIIAPAINLVIAQRLLRRLCRECSRVAPISEELSLRLAPYLQTLPERAKKQISLPQDGLSKIKIKTAVGCPLCHNTGYKGRVGVFELMLVEEEMEKLIHASPTEVGLRDLAKKLGMTTMMQDAIIKLLQGLVDAAEIERVVGPI